MSEYIIALNETEGERIAQLAAGRGYDSIASYLRALIAADALVEVLHEDWRDADEDEDLLEAEFRQSWHDAMTGRVFPVERLWDMLDDDDE